MLHLNTAEVTDRIGYVRYFSIPVAISAAPVSDTNNIEHIVRVSHIFII